MKTLAKALSMILFASPLLSQTTTQLTGIKTFDLVSPWDHSSGKAVFVRERRMQSCLDLMTLAQKCDVHEELSYGNRFGVNWDIFALNGQQTRIVEVGKYKLTDKFDIPYIRPWAKLRPSERRNITVNTSGADGKPGANADGTVNKTKVREGLADKPVARQVSTAVKRSDGSKREDIYTPFMQIAEGRLYAIRVLHGEDDYYLLVHVDKLIRGEKATISVMLAVSPPKPVY